MSKFTTQHYRAIAETLREAWDLELQSGHGEEFETVTLALAKMFEEDNPRFERDVFLLAATPEF